MPLFLALESRVKEWFGQCRPPKLPEEQLEVRAQQEQIIVGHKGQSIIKGFGGVLGARW